MGGFEMNARAIFFHHHHGAKLVAPFKTFTNFSLVDGRPKLNDLVDSMFTMTQGMLDEVGAVSHGHNPEVFTYRIHREADFELLELTFYGSLKVIFCIDHPPAVA